MAQKRNDCEFCKVNGSKQIWEQIVFVKQVLSIVILIFYNDEEEFQTASVSLITRVNKTYGTSVLAVSTRWVDVF